MFCLSHWRYYCLGSSQVVYVYVTGIVNVVFGGQEAIHFDIASEPSNLFLHPWPPLSILDMHHCLRGAQERPKMALETRTYPTAFLNGFGA